MKTKLLFLLGLIALASFAHAEDVDIYGISDIDVKPNVLIILDNSGSMDTEDVPGDPYASGTTYSGDYSANMVYVKEVVWEWKYIYGRWRKVQVEKWNLYFDDITSSDWQCQDAKDDLLGDGFWTGELAKSGDIVTCSGYGTAKEYAVGNYLNFDASSGNELRSRMEVAKEVVANLIYENHENVNFGLMAFNTEEGVSYYDEDEYDYLSWYGNGGYIIAGCGADKTTLIGSYEPGDTMSLYAQSGYGAVGKLGPDTNTPLAETLGEAGLYFAGKKSWFNGTTTGDGYPLGRFSSSCTENNTGCRNYSDDSPIEWRCQKNYIILVTDGEPTRDDDKFADFNYIIDSILPEASDGNSSYLDDVANLLKNNDIRLDLGSAGDFEDQTVTTYTIGFTDEVDAELLASTAVRGGGEYYQAASAAQLGRALTNILMVVGEQNEIFTAAAVPISRANKAYAGNYVYYGLFQPTNSGNWLGNLKKYALTNDGNLEDKYGNTAVSGGAIINNAVSFWSSSADGPSVAKGGVGECLANRATERNIYTYTGTTSALTAESNRFVTTNTALTSGSYSGLTATVIDAVRNGVSDDWPLGSLLHSQPLVVHYDTNSDGNDDHSVLYAGANDGMLHCFDDETGEELWGFVPQDLLPNLSLLESSGGLEYFVDGTPVSYTYDHDNNTVTPDKKLVIFGERRGGTSYTALDISDYTAPAFKYSISSTILGTEPLGQSWAAPRFHSMGYMDSTYKTKDVFLMAGGYDINQDKEAPETPATEDSMGRAVYAVDAQTGALFSDFLFSHANYPAMTHSIIAVSGFENPKTRTTTRVYAGDMNGNLFAFRDDIFHRNRDISKKDEVAFGGLYDGQEDGVWGQKLKLYSVPGKKIWYAPNILNEYFPVEFTYPAGEISETEDVVVTQKRVGDYVFFGTGDRAHPQRKDILNGFYAIKNNWQWSGETAEIVDAYCDVDDNGKVKAKSDNSDIVDWDEDTEDTKLFVLDVTDDLIQNGSVQDTYYIKKAMNHKNNRGWFIRLEEIDGSQVGEKVVSSPVIYDGVIYFSTYVPIDMTVDTLDDPCVNTAAEGYGYVYALGYHYGDAAINFYSGNDVDGEPVRQRQDRRVKLKNNGIPPELVMVVLEGGTKILEGPEIIDPKSSASVERAYWRQLNN